MKKNNKFRMLLSLWILGVFIFNLITPTVVFATENINSKSSINISIERRVLGQEDILKNSNEEIVLGEIASVSIDRIFKENNILYKNTGTLESNFYISEIITPEGEFLSEFDHGSYSGWKYSVNGVYPNVGLADYKFNDGDTVRIQYTAKDMGQDILVVDTIFDIRDKLKEAEDLLDKNYTDQTINNLKDVISDIKEEIPSDIEIGEMMSQALGNGNCDTYNYGKKMNGLLANIEDAINQLEEKPMEPEIPSIEPEFEIDIFSDWDKIKWDTDEQPNTVYLDEGQKSVGAQVIRLSDSNLPFLFNGVEVPVEDKVALIELTPGIHTLSVTRWGDPYDIIVVCKTAPYTIEGNLTPGGTVTINFNGAIEEGLKNGSSYKLKETNVEYVTNIPGLKKVTSEIISGETVDRDILSKITFTIPEDTEPGEYELTEGGVYQTWGGTSYGSDMFKGKFSILPNVKITINEKMDLTDAYSINLKNWSKFDKVYTLENSATLILDGISTESVVLLNGTEVSPTDDVYAVNIEVGNNTISVDNTEYVISCKKVSYKIANENKIIPGSEVTVQFEGLEKAFGYIQGEHNPYLVKTIFKSNIVGLDTVESDEAGSFTAVNDEILNTITFKIPEDTDPGKYELFDGSIYQEWYGFSVPGKTDRYFSILPKVEILVRDSIPEDNVAPEISTTLTDNLSVTKESLSFKVIATDDVDGKITPTVKLNGKNIVEVSSDQYSVILEEGVNTIEIEAVDDAGNKAYKAFSVTYAPTLREGASIILDTLSLVLLNGETHQLIAVDAPDSRSNETDDTARMTYTVISGEDVVKVNKYGLVTTLKSGFAKISVRYPGLTTSAIVEVQVKDSNDENSPKITTTIEETKYDILYYLDDFYNYSFTAEAEGSTIEVIANDEVITSVNGVYNVKLTEGYNPITVKATKDGNTTYEIYNLRAKKLEINIENATNPGEDIVQGDKVRISFTGLETPVPKFLRVFNPKRTRVEYKTDMPGATNIFGSVSQYDIATNNTIEFTANSVGVFNFTSGNIEEQWWGDELFNERDISSEGPNTTAVVREGNFSSLPDFTIEIKENNDYVNNIAIEVINEGTIKAGDEVVLAINNLEMPEVDRGSIIQAYTIFNTDIKGLNEIKSENAANNYGNLQTIKFTIPEDTKAGTYTITNGRVFKEWQPGVLYVDSEFYKGELPEINIVVTEEEEEVVPPIDTNTPVEVIIPSITVDEAIKSAIKWTYENVSNPTFGNEWDVLGLVRSGLFNNSEYLELYYKNLVQVVKEKNGVLSRNKYTEYSRTIIALTALGKNPRDVGGYDLLENLYDYNKVSLQGINGIIFALIALDTKDYEIPENVTNSREKMISAILDSQLEDGGFALSGTIGDVDVTGMALQALAKYKDRDDVKAVIDKSIEFLSKEQLEDGGYTSEGVKTLESSVQALVALTALEIEPKSQPFVKNKNWIVSDMINFIAEDGGFKHTLDQIESNDMATEQGLYGLVSYRRYVNGETSLYDMSDVTLDNNDNGNNGSGNNGGSGNGNGNDNGGSSNGNGNTGSAGGSSNGNAGSTGGNSNNSVTENNNGQTSGNVNLGTNNGSVSQNNESNNVDSADNKEESNDEKDSNNEQNINDEEAVKEEIEDNKIDDVIEENYEVGTNKEPLSNIQVVFITLAVVCVVLALKEFIVIQYKRKKQSN